jgi:hypothetical protein
MEANGLTALLSPDAAKGGHFVDDHICIDGLSIDSLYIGT